MREYWPIVTEDRYLTLPSQSLWRRARYKADDLIVGITHMLVGDDSPLRRLPMEMPRRQVLFFDGIRMAFEMFDLPFARLRGTLAALAEDATQQEGAIASAMQDAWSVVDSAALLKVL